jgi:magnesium-transporting ATPase (P-type)
LYHRGAGVGVVVSTGDHTEIGTTNASVNKVKAKKTNVLKQIDAVSKYAIFIESRQLHSGGSVAYFKASLRFLTRSTSLVRAVARFQKG